MGPEWQLINIDDLTPLSVWKLHVYSFACDNSLIRCVHKGSICAEKGGGRKKEPSLNMIDVDILETTKLVYGICYVYFEEVVPFITNIITDLCNIANNYQCWWLSK